MMSSIANITAYITTWKKEEFSFVKDQLIRLGMPANQIVIVKDKVSRPISANKSLNSCPTEFAMLLDDDVLLDNDPLMFDHMLSYFKDPKVGLVSTCVSQVAEFQHNLKNPNDFKARDFTLFLNTLNCVIVRKDAARFDENYFGNQLLDIDFGLELKKNGFIAVMDGSTHLQHVQTNYIPKNLFYHVVVARNRHYFHNKWSGLKEEVPSIEYLTHAAEDELLVYLKMWEMNGASLYLNSRFGNNIKEYLGHIQKVLAANTEIIWSVELNQEAIPYNKEEYVKI